MADTKDVRSSITVREAVAELPEKDRKTRYGRELLVARKIVELGEVNTSGIQVDFIDSSRGSRFGGVKLSYNHPRTFKTVWRAVKVVDGEVDLEKLREKAAELRELKETAQRKTEEYREWQSKKADKQNMNLEAAKIVLEAKGYGEQPYSFLRSISVGEGDGKTHVDLSATTKGVQMKMNLTVEQMAKVLDLLDEE